MPYPAFKPTPEQRKQVEQYAARGASHDDICAMILGRKGDPIDRGTLAKHFRKELDQGKAKANLAIGGALFTKAMSGDVASMIFWLKCQGRWSPPKEDRRQVDDEEIDDPVR